MINKLLDLICPARKRVSSLEGIISYITEVDESKRLQIQRLEDVLAHKRTELASTIDKLYVTSHAIHRYRERHNGKGTDDDISTMLYKCMIQQLATTDTLMDGTYDLKRGLRGRIQNNTLVTILPKRDIGAPRLK